MLRPLVESHGPHVLWAQGCLSPPHWQWMCSAKFLLRKIESREAYFSALGPPCPRAQDNTVVAKREKRVDAAVQELLSDPAVLSSVRLQSTVSLRIQEAALPFDGSQLLLRRAQVLAGAAPTPSAIASALAGVGCLTGTTAMQVWRAWLGGFTTTRRFHSVTQLKCVFGCPDEQKHYMACSRLWLAIARVTVDPRPEDAPLSRLALGACSDEIRGHQLKQLAVATSVYQAFSRDPRLQALAARARATRDLRSLGRSILSVAVDRALTHGGRNFAKVPRELSA